MMKAHLVPILSWVKQGWEKLVAQWFSGWFGLSCLSDRSGARSPFPCWDCSIPSCVCTQQLWTCPALLVCTHTPLQPLFTWLSAPSCPCFCIYFCIFKFYYL